MQNTTTQYTIERLYNAILRISNLQNALYYTIVQYIGCYNTKHYKPGFNLEEVPVGSGLRFESGIFLIDLRFEVV